jgi:ankyrin repeat protein
MAISAIRFLLKVGADINIKNAASLLPLHQACKVNHLPLEIFKSLIERTREIDFKDNLGKTPLDYLLEHKRFHPFILHYLIEKGMKLTNAQVEKAVEVICDLEEIINFSKENEFQKLKKHLENYNIKPKNKLKTITEIPLDLSFKGHLQRVNIKNKNDSERIAETITDEKITDTVLNCGIPHSRTSFFRDINNNNNSSYVKDSKREIEPDDNQFHDSTEKVQEALDSELELAKKLSLQPFKF